MLAKMNKKAAMGEGPKLLDYLSLLILIVTIVLSMLIYANHSSEVKNKINEVLATQESEYLLLNLLRTPIEIEGISSDVSQLISLWYMDPGKYQDEIESNISKILDDFYDGEVDWELTAKGKKEESIQTKNLIEKIQSKIATTPITEAKTDIPLHYNPYDKIINITLKTYLNTVEENTWCYNLIVDGCDVDLIKLCHCDRVGYKLLWTNCEICKRGCDPIRERCR